jgi:hypothetical protein
MMPEAFISHCTENRLRVKIPAHRGDVSYFARLGEKFSGMGGLERLDVNPTTGSLLFVGKGIDVEAIKKHGEEFRVFRLRGLPSGPVPAAEKVASSLKELNDGLHRFTGGDVDLAGMAFLTLVGIGIYQISRGNIGAMPWYTAFWYAFGVFTKSMADRFSSGSE